MTMKIIDSGANLSENSISAFEKQFDIKLPPDYRAFMLKNNGGTPEGNWSFSFVETDMQGDTDSIISFFEIIYEKETGDYDDLKAGFTALLESEQIPNTLMPIADDPFGNIIFIGVRGDEYGRVYFGNHELEDPETGFIVMSVIADSFSEFIDNCYEV
jgi:cell wall assembly regulator SMI1